jgi:hypothetical protein
MVFLSKKLLAAVAAKSSPALQSDENVVFGMAATVISWDVDGVLLGERPSVWILANVPF